MPAISDIILQSGSDAIQQLHGEPVDVLSGPDSGLTYHGVAEVDSDAALDSVLGADYRARRFVRFQQHPNLRAGDMIRISGKVFFVVKNLGNSFLTSDFEIVEKTDSDT